MRRRRVIAGLVVVLAVAAVALWPRPPRPCRATFERVREGMTQDEVYAAVGGRPGDYSNGAGGKPMAGISSFAYSDEWRADDGYLVVDYDYRFRTRGPDPHSDLLELDPDVPFRVRSARVQGFPPRTLWSRLRSRLGL
jgi:hypothetical protein